MDIQRMKTELGRPAGDQFGRVVRTLELAALAGVGTEFTRDESVMLLAEIQRLRSGFDALLVERGLSIENYLKVCQQAADLQERLATAETRVMGIIHLALAGYEDAYKYTDARGQRYTRWGEVERDIRAELRMPKEGE